MAGQGAGGAALHLGGRRVTRPRAPFPPGEYALLSQVDMDRWQKYPSTVRIYSVGVD